MAGLPTQCSAEPETLVVGVGLERRERLILDGPRLIPEDYYRTHRTVLVRLSGLSIGTLPF
jgi:hypothetical protein